MLVDFHFIRPEWFFALFPLVILLTLIKRLPKHHADWEGIISAHLLTQLFPTEGKRRVRSSILPVLSVASLLSIVAAAGPTFEKIPQPVFSVNQGHVIVMDMSMSMRSTDISPDRLTRAKFKAIDLIKQINEGEIGVVAYAGDAFTISPLTEDIGTLEALIPSLSPEIMPMEGSDAFIGLTHAADLLLQAGYPSGKIYWITDGIELSETQELLEWVNQSQMQVNILAVGTAEGAPITLSNGELLKDGSGSIVIPQMRFSSLASIAKRSGGHASEITANDKDIETLSSSILPPQASEPEEGDAKLGGDQWRELGPVLVIIALPFAAYLFRRGLIALFVLTFVSFTQPVPSAWAKETAETDTSSGMLANVSKWFKNADQRGLESFQKEQFDDAAESFQDPMWQGAAHYRNGNYEDALEAYSQVDTAQSWYNQGNALAQMGKLEEASNAYQNALDRQPGFEQARDNKDLVDKLMDQQQQNDQNQGQGDNQDQQEQDSSEQDNQQNSESMGQNNDEQPQTGDQNQQDSDSQKSGQQGADDNSQQQNQNNESQSKQSSDGEQSQDPQQQDQQNETQPFDDKPQSEAQRQGESPSQGPVQNMQASPSEMTDEEREKQQQIEALLRRIPNDPAYLLQRKMQLESQKRARRRSSVSQEKKW